MIPEHELIRTAENAVAHELERFLVESNIMQKLTRSRHVVWRVPRAEPNFGNSKRLSQQSPPTVRCRTWGVRDQIIEPS